MTAHPLARWRGVVVLLLALAVVVAGSTVSAPPTALAEPAPPTDAFYTPPPGLAAAPPGTILRTRPVTVHALQLLPVSVDAWQVLYRTTDADGRPDATVTTVLAPRGDAPRKLLSYQAATDSTLRICNPSYTLTHTGPIDLRSPSGPVTLGLPSVELLLAVAGVQQGWTVAIPDHGGLDARFLTPHQPGYAVLDGVRAVQSFAPSGTRPGGPVSMWGYSGGAIATSWAVEEQPTYAPDVDIVGAAMGAPERDLVASLKAANGSAIGGLIPMALAAIAKDSPAFATAVSRYLTPGGRRIVEDIRSHCVSQNGLSNLWFDYRAHLTRPVDTVLADPAIRRSLAERGVTGRTPAAPIYIYNGVTDEVAPIVGTDTLARSYCRGGASVTYRRETLPPNPLPQIMSTHGVIAVTGAPGAFSWLRQRMNGLAATPGCDWRSAPSTLLEPSAFAELGPLVTAAVRALSGRPLP